MEPDRPVGSSEVLIVGAGPVGVALGCDLLQRGVRVRLVDSAAAPAPAPRSRAVLVWPRTLELLRGIGVAERLAATGHRLTGIGYRSEGRLLGRAAVDRIADTPYPFAATLPQYETERLLLERLAELGGTVERGVVLEDLRQDARGVTARLRHPDGNEEQAHARWLVGADGAHSSVRKQLGIGFDGDTVDVTFGIADAPIDGPAARDTLHYCYTADGALGVVPLPDGLFRVAISIPHRDPAEPPPAGVFAEALRRRAPGLGELGEPRWTGSFRVRCRIADRFRDGNCFLAGDAAHIISPAGGQGMNYGLQDAFNLGWKLAGVLRGTLDAAVLDSYHRERHAAVARVAAVTAAQTRWGMIAGGPRRVLRDTLVRGAALGGLLRRRIAPMMAQTDVSYAADGLRRARPGHPRPGDRLPVFAPEAPEAPEALGGPAAAATAPADPALDRDGFTVLVRRPSGPSGPAGPGDRGSAAVAAALVGRPAVVRTVDDTASATLLRALGPRPVLVALRPDGHVQYVAPATRSGLADLVRHLDGLAPRTRTAPEPAAARG
ncbi:FAD-dependent monooxygenase [Kitasatospora sp. NPDC088783]|uniref:FAD-dependent monooxygenase n=1 Tax=Kitasatospora sp. NPDC088783 TaxID=3364077 RepID=UPI00381F1D5E